MANSSDPHGIEQRRIIAEINKAYRAGSITAYERHAYIRHTIAGNYRAWPQRWFADTLWR